MRAIGTELKNALLSKKFVSAVVIAMGLLLVSICKDLYAAVVEETYVQGFHDQLFHTAAQSQLVILGMSVICALPFATSYIADAKSKFILLRLTRCSKRSYIIGKIISAYLVGGLTTLLAFVLFYVLLVVGLMPVEISIGLENYFLTGMISCLPILIVYFCAAGFFSLAAFLLGSLSMNYYIAYVSSFILFYMMVILHERYLKGYGLLDPEVWLTGYESYPFGLLGVALVSIILSLMCAAGIYSYLDRRLLFE